MEKCTVGRCLGLDSADEGGVSVVLGTAYVPGGYDFLAL